ncbi:hypothetical protein QQM79_14140 [Marinobacteraceae bacterium S3BR75-40.1]
METSSRKRSLKSLVLILLSTLLVLVGLNALIRSSWSSHAVSADAPKQTLSQMEAVAAVTPGRV